LTRLRLVHTYIILKRGEGSDKQLSI